MPVKEGESFVEITAAEYGRCTDVNLEINHDMVWAYDFCPTNVAWMATFGLILYLAFFAPGKCVECNIIYKMIEN